ncbi:MAG: hypothetical protein JWN52_1969 [Actinomycetia bacterium]|nr:hypothetical protein [Actinomycetes bacterium]
MVYLVAAAGVGLAVVSGASPASAATAQSSAAAKSATHSSTAVSAASLSRKSFPCKSPKGKKLTLSWSKKASHFPGITSYRFYFNNHCNQKRTISVNFTRKHRKPESYLIKVNAHANGDKGRNIANWWKLVSVTAY